MREFDGELPRQAFPLVLPKPYGFEEAVRRGRALRRRRTAGTGAGIMTLLLGIVGASVLGRGPDAGSNLKFTDRSGDRVEQGEPRLPGVDLPPPASAPAASPAVTAARGDRPRVDAAPRVPGVVHQDPAPVPVPQVSNPVTGPARRPPAKGELARAAIDAPNACAPVINPPQRGWCTVVSIAGSGRDRTLQFDVCRDIGADQPGGLQFRTTQEADLAIVDGAGKQRWTWSLGRAFAPGHDGNTLTVQRGGCIRWSYYWTGTDDWGRALPGGTYRVRGWSLADGFEGRDPAETSVDI